MNELTDDEKRTIKAERDAEFKRAQRAADRAHAPYGEWCRNPDACRGKGHCPLDPSCGD
jgi:hypothetical protein